MQTRARERRSARGRRSLVVAPRRSSRWYAGRRIRLRRALAILCLAIATGVATAAALPSPVRERDVVVAARDIRPGSIIASEDLRLVRVAVAVAPPGALTAAASAVGRSAAFFVPTGAVIAISTLDAARAYAKLADPGDAILTIGARASPLTESLTNGQHIVLLLGIPATSRAATVESGPSIDDAERTGAPRRIAATVVATGSSDPSGTGRGAGGALAGNGPASPRILRWQSVRPTSGILL